MHKLTGLTAAIAMAASALVVGACGSSTADQPEPETGAKAALDQPGSQNAAEEYRSLHQVLNQARVSRLIGISPDSSDASASEIDAALEEEQTQQLIDRLIWATKLDRVDWGIDEGNNKGLQISHLGKLRDFARLLNAEAERAARNTNAGRSANAVAAIVRLGRHTGDTDLTETLTSLAIVALAAETAETHAETWNPEQRQRILAELQRIDLENPYDFDARVARAEQGADRAGVSPSTESFERAREQFATRIGDAIEALEE